MQLLIVRFILTLVIAIISTNQIFGGSYTESILIQGDTVIDDEKKIELLINTSKKLENLSTSLSLKAINQAYLIANKNNNSDLSAQCNHQLGKIQIEDDSITKAITNLKKALSYFENLDNKVKTASILVDIGNAYSKSHQYKRSLIYFNSALAVYTELDDSIGIVNCYTNIGISNKDLMNNDLAISFFNSALNTSLRNNYDKYAAINYLNISAIQLELGFTDSVYYQIQNAINLAEQAKENYILADAYLLYNKYYISIGDKTEATNQIVRYLNLSDSLNKLRSIVLEELLLDSTNKIAQPRKTSTTKYLSLIIIFLLLLAILFLLLKIKNQKTFFFNFNKKTKDELNAYMATTSNLKETIEQKTKDKVAEIEEAIAKNKNDNVALNQSIKKLDQINYLKDIFLSKISHEIRTPLSGILGFSSILETELALLEDQSLFDYANSISQSGSSLVSLLNNILDISRLDSNNMTLDIKKLNTNELIQGIVDTYVKEASLKGIKLIYPSIDTPDISTDSMLFSKILTLILDNSIKFTEKGFIKISHSYDKITNIITILIKDTGIGIDKVYIDKVFEPFRQESLGYSTSYQGAGLGLPLAKKMTEKLGGNININSEKGNGTTIILKFPGYQENKEKDTTSTVEIKNDLKKQTLPWKSLSVLVVEDDPMNQILYRKMLQKSRILEIAKNGKAALNIIEKNEGNNNFQIVLMDINLPAPWDGISLMKEIRSRWPAYQDIPFIAQTAYAMSGTKEDMMNEGFDDYITKPIIKSTLIKSFNSVIST